MTSVAETVDVSGTGMGPVAGETTEAGSQKVRVSRRDRRMVRAALGIMGVLAALDAVLYLGRFI